MVAKTHVFFQDYKLYLGIFTSGAAKSNKIDISWDPTKTTITSAVLDGEIWAQEGTCANIVFNGEEIFGVDASLTPGGNGLTASKDVTGYLKNGINEVVISVWKSPLPVWLDKRGEFTAILTITFEGTDPNIEPWWKKYLLPVGVGVASLIGGIGIALLAMRRR